MTLEQEISSAEFDQREIETELGRIEEMQRLCALMLEAAQSRYVGAVNLVMSLKKRQ